MNSRKRIGLFYTYDENWIAGAYYILNLIEALNLLPDEAKPQLSVFYTKAEEIKKIEEIHYPYIDFREIENNSQFLKRVIRFLVRKTFNKLIFKSTLKLKPGAGYYDAIFPALLGFDNSISKKTIYWIPDFQEAHLPHFFSEKEIKNRQFWQGAYANSGETIIFSSYDSQKDFVRLYPGNNVKQSVVQFAVIHPPYHTVSFDDIKKKYQLPEEYFFCPNQFWAHKNHLVVLEAIKKLESSHSRTIKVVFTGKLHDFRTPGYHNEITKYINENSIAENVLMLGFIDRKEQLQIMKHALAVIQPSLFEGWSTIVEDTKAMNQNIIVSDISVHKEQLGDKTIYFDPKNSDTLVEILKNYKKTRVEFNYRTNQLKFGSEFLKIAVD